MADGPDGNQWYYTQNYKLDGYFYSGSTITLYDNNNQQVGQFDIDVPDTLQVNSIEMYSALTKKMFDRDDTSIEAMVSIHAVGNAENNYKDSYITRAYHIDGSGIAYECEGSGMLFDAPRDGTPTSVSSCRSRSYRRQGVCLHRLHRTAHKG